MHSMFGIFEKLFQNEVEYRFNKIVKNNTTWIQDSAMELKSNK